VSNCVGSSSAFAAICVTSICKTRAISRILPPMSTQRQFDLVPLIQPADDPLVRLHRDLQFVSETVVTILDSLPVQRRPIPDWAKALHVRVTLLRRNGYCPCCQQTQVCSADGKTTGAEFDHWYGRHRNGPGETWLVCSDCNRRLENTSFKSSVRSAFEAYQDAVSKFLAAGQNRLFL
jgi:hypothetical protein